MFHSYVRLPEDNHEYHFVKDSFVAGPCFNKDSGGANGFANDGLLGDMVSPDFHIFQSLNMLKPSTSSITNHPFLTIYTTHKNGD